MAIPAIIGAILDFVGKNVQGDINTMRNKDAYYETTAPQAVRKDLVSAGVSEAAATNAVAGNPTNGGAVVSTQGPEHTSITEYQHAQNETRKTDAETQLIREQAKHEATKHRLTGLNAQLFEDTYVYMIDKLRYENAEIQARTNYHNVQSDYINVQREGKMIENYILNGIKDEKIRQAYQQSQLNAQQMGLNEQQFNYIVAQTAKMYAEIKQIEELKSVREQQAAFAEWKMKYQVANNMPFEATQNISSAIFALAQSFGLDTSVVKTAAKTFNKDNIDLTFQREILGPWQPFVSPFIENHKRKKRWSGGSSQW